MEGLPAEAKDLWTMFITARAFMISFIVGVLPWSGAFAQQPDTTGQDTLDLSRRVLPQGDIRESNPILTGAALTDASFPGSWPMFGKEYRMKIGGYVKADLLYDFDGTTDRTQFLMSTIPVEGTPEHDLDGYLSFFTKEARFNIDVRRTKAGAVPLRVFVEGDFFTPATQFRLRHAYIAAGSFIIGQTWTTLSVLESLPYMIDFASGDALFGGRTSQVRYQKKVSDKFQWAASLENLPTMGIDHPDSLLGIPSLGLPLLAARVDYTWRTGILVVGSSLAQLRWDGGSGGQDADALQYDLVVAGRQYVFKSDYFTWNLSMGNGSGENIMAFAGSDANAVLTPEYKLETMSALAFVAGYMHKWSDKYSSNLSYAYGWLDAPPTRAPLALQEGGVGHVNLIFRPASQFSCGVEYMWGVQITSNEARGEARRIQFMTKLEF